jgi:cytoskeletal protein CcmA (bactofilin family)
MFPKKPEPESSPMRNAPSSVLGPDTAIKGDVSASADLHVDGKVEGDITCASLIQGETSVIIGGITAESARLSGTVHGSITTRELVVLKTARIHGDVHYDALTIEQGAQVDGRLSPRGPATAAETPESGEAHLVLASSTS